LAVAFSAKVERISIKPKAEKGLINTSTKVLTDVIIPLANKTVAEKRIIANSLSFILRVKWLPLRQIVYTIYL
jgi:hypothetical protein